MFKRPRAAEADRRATRPVNFPRSPPSPVGGLLDLQQLAGNRAVTALLVQRQGTIEEAAGEASEQAVRNSLAADQQRASGDQEPTLLRPGHQHALQRDFSQEWPVLDGAEGWVEKRRLKARGNVVVTADGEATSRPVTRDMDFESGSGNEVNIAVDLQVDWDEWRKSWRFGEYGWKRPLGRMTFEYKAVWRGQAQDGSMDVTFVSSTDPKLQLSFFGSTSLEYEARPSALGDTAVLTIVAYRGSQPMEVTTRIKLQPPETESLPGPKFVERSLVVDGFPSGKATITAENLRKIEEFWYGLTPETRTAIQNDQLLNGQKVRVTGHTDNTDRAPANFNLGYERARAVVEVLRRLSGNTEGTNFAPMTQGEREMGTDDPAKEAQDPAQRKVAVELWEEQNVISKALDALKQILGGSSP